MSKLFEPITLRSLTMRNRVWVAPMCQYSATDGVPDDWHLVHLGARATGGFGLVMTEASAVVPEGRISPQDAGIWNDEQAEAWRRIVEFVHAQGAPIGVQLAHAGRKASTYRPWDPRAGTVASDDGGWEAVAPSDVPFEGYAAPAALTVDQVAEVVRAFAEAARRAVSVGFDTVEIHAAHGYLLHQFLSPLANRRTDEYGGTLENRARLLLRVVAAVRAEAPEAPLFVRFSATDWAEGGWTVEETATVAAWAAEHGADFFDISSGGLVAHQRIVPGPGYQVHLARHVREAAGVPVSAVGLIDSGPQAEEILRRGDADAIMSAREWLRDPHFALRAADEVGADIDYWPVQYTRARRRR